MPPPVPGGAVRVEGPRPTWLVMPPLMTGRAAVRRWAWLLALTATLVAGAWVLYAHDPVRAGFFPRCLIYTWTGYHCPGCGSTRATHHLLHGRVWAAFRYNPLLVLTLPFFAYEFGRLVVRTVRPRPFLWKAVHPLRIWAPTALIIAFWVARNLPFRPFSWLAPTDVSSARSSSRTPAQSEAR
jgi:hypothetical protein